MKAEREKKTAIIKVPMTETGKAEVEAYAAELEISVSALIRLALKEYMSKHSKGDE